MPKECKKIELPETIEDRRELIRKMLGKDVIIRIKNLDTYLVGHISHPDKDENDESGFYFAFHDRKDKEKILYRNLNLLLLGPYIVE